MIDTIIDGVEMSIAKINKLGQLVYEDYPDSSFTKMYTSSDLRNYKDGDARSSMKVENWKKRMDPDEATKNLYNPDTDAEGMLTTQISNTMRVFKGGGWRDRPYWLNPGTRRYLEQKESRDDLGFRCSMDRFGPTQKYE